MTFSVYATPFLFLALLFWTYIGNRCLKMILISFCVKRTHDTILLVFKTEEQRTYYARRYLDSIVDIYSLKGSKQWGYATFKIFRHATYDVSDSLGATPTTIGLLWAYIHLLGWWCIINNHLPNTWCVGLKNGWDFHENVSLIFPVYVDGLGWGYYS